MKNDHAVFSSHPLRFAFCRRSTRKHALLSQMKKKEKKLKNKRKERKKAPLSCEQRL